MVCLFIFFIYTITPTLTSIFHPFYFFTFVSHLFSNATVVKKTKNLEASNFYTSLTIISNFYSIYISQTSSCNFNIFQAIFCYFYMSGTIACNFYTICISWTISFNFYIFLTISCSFYSLDYCL